MDLLLLMWVYSFDLLVDSIRCSDTCSDAVVIAIEIARVDFSLAIIAAKDQ